LEKQFSKTFSSSSNQSSSIINPSSQSINQSLTIAKEITVLRIIKADHHGRSDIKEQ